jgi:hypothetical protein
MRPSAVSKTAHQDKHKMKSGSSTFHGENGSVVSGQPIRQTASENQAE